MIHTFILWPFHMSLFNECIISLVLDKWYEIWAETEFCKQRVATANSVSNLLDLNNNISDKVATAWGYYSEVVIQMVLFW